VDVALGKELEPEMADEVEKIVDVDPAAYLQLGDIRHDEGRVYPSGSPTAREKIEKKRNYEEEIAAEPACTKGNGFPDLPAGTGVPLSDIIQSEL
jgi:hypothetical protein